METKYLLTSKVKPWGWLLFIAGLSLGIMGLMGGYEPEILDTRVPDFFDYQIKIGNSEAPSSEEGSEPWPPMINNNLLDEVALSMLLLGGLFLMLARRKNEDEYIMKLRLESILWAAIFNAIIMLVAVWLIYDLAFFYVMVSGLFFFYLLFIVRFEWVLIKLKTANHEE